MKKTISLGLLLILLLTVCVPVRATQPAETTAPAETAPQVQEIYTPEDLQAIAENPEGHYMLMNHLDMTGIQWKPVDLICGSFDGNGYAIVNLTVNQVGDTIDASYDGNLKKYDTSFAGLFGVLWKANVTNLELVNVQAVVQSDVPCFLGGLTGAMYDSTLTDCSVSGTLELRAHDRMFGVGGIAGYGSGAMERCKADVTLICTDTDQEKRDEQFMGGAYSTGFIDLVDCQVTIDGYSSEYGYAHNGGLVGMMMQKPLAVGRTGRMTGNTITGKITFFEKNTDRRAYCKGLIGEALVQSLTRKDNTEDFLRDERKDYSRELRPEMCEEPVYGEVVVNPGCDSFGYTEYTCQGCGYVYTDKYTLPAHSVTTWTVTKEPTVEEEGLSVAYCDGCGLEYTRPEPKLEPLPTETTVPPTEAPAEPEKESLLAAFPWKKYLPMGAGVVAVILVLALIFNPRKKGKYEK